MENLQDLLDKYETIGQIGLGTSSRVLKGFVKGTNKTVTLKMISCSDGVPCYLIREVSFLKEMEHSNIVSLLEVVGLEYLVCVVLEDMDLNLKEFMDSPDIEKNQKVIKWLLYQLLHGLAYCHSQKVLHRDLKPQNLLIDHSTLTLKLADFGSATEFDVPREELTEWKRFATLCYMAPELLFGDLKYSTAVDMWSVGCIFAEMVIQKPLFDASDVFKQVNEIFSIIGKPNEKTWPEVTSLFDILYCFENTEPKNLAEVVPRLEPTGVDLLSKMLCMNPKGRITAADALKHPFFADVERI